MRALSLASQGSQGSRGSSRLLTGNDGLSQSDPRFWGAEKAQHYGAEPCRALECSGRSVGWLVSREHPIVCISAVLQQPTLHTSGHQDRARHTPYWATWEHLSHRLLLATALSPARISR
ncbi:hypothetical protein NDU88_004662 [Pleurodeles waltl]|uniref:Uncharacterized protein n=1 Tax=Pleurodeles waltl TaxID=8319 RepID=A0AAV7W5K9_PLEWA|nr:hypothetical protein NDU88_004662 [Pleurodeles waltl]